MIKFLPTLLFFLSLGFVILYVALKFKANKEFSFANSFPFESNKTSLAIRTSFILIFAFSLCSIFFYLNIYFNIFKNNYILIATIATFAICILFLFLNIVNLVNLKVHFLLFSAFAAIVTTSSVVLGFHAINAYKIDSTIWMYIVVAVIHFIKALFELILVSPLFKFSFLMDVNVDDGTLKRPKFIRLAFYEWLYLFFFIINNFLLLIVQMV
ncbi:MAG: hypothetical protein K6E21_06135 [Bacilli bacterium]|nr:hypothetical protein [Bacilli bacterium]